MASGNQVFEQVRRKDGSLESGEDLERFKEYLQEVMKKNQDLEDMLLYTTHELQKEKENSRKIVQTLTERLMESREMINKLEVENMRYKKDCILAVELLQCNKSVDQERVSSTVKKLLNYTVPDTAVGDHTYPTGKAITADKNEQIRARTVSKKKTKSEASNEDTTALLAKKETNEVKVEIRPRTSSKKNIKSEDSNEDTTALLAKQETNEDEVEIRPRTSSKKNIKSEDSNEDTTALLAKQETNEDEVEIRPRTSSNKKTKSEDSNKDTTALLAKQETNVAEMIGKEVVSSTRENKIPSMSKVNNTKQKQSDKSLKTDQ